MKNRDRIHLYHSEDDMDKSSLGAYEQKLKMLLYEWEKVYTYRGVNTVYRYRRASGKLLVKETEELRKTMDEILSEIIKEWDGYEQVFQNG